MGSLGQDRESGGGRGQGEPGCFDCVGDVDPVCGALM